MADAHRPKHLGAGVGFRGEVSSQMIAHAKEFDCFEVMCDSFFRAERTLSALKTLKPLVPHSLSLSVGSELDPDYMQKVKRIVDATGNPWYSDHLCFTRAGEVAVGHLTTLPWNEESLDLVVRNTKEVMRTIGPNFALENITNVFTWPTSTMDESTFINEVVRRTGCSLLLDVENVRINAINHGFDPYKFLASLPLERVVQVHLAGGTEGHGIALDSHNAPVHAQTWELLRYLVEHVQPRATILEHDEDFPPMPQLIQDVRTAREIVGGPGD